MLTVVGLRTIPREVKQRASFGVLLCAVIGFVVFRVLKWIGAPITAKGLSASLAVFLLLVSLDVFAGLFFGSRWTAAERGRLVVILDLFLTSALFWAIFEQAGSTLNLFAERNTNCSLLAYRFPASWLQSLSSLFIILFAPVFA